MNPLGIVALSNSANTVRLAGEREWSLTSGLLAPSEGVTRVRPLIGTLRITVEESPSFHCVRSSEKIELHLVVLRVPTFFLLPSDVVPPAGVLHK